MVEDSADKEAEEHEDQRCIETLGMLLSLPTAGCVVPICMCRSRTVERTRS
jgi:hypothetical protein